MLRQVLNRLLAVMAGAVLGLGLGELGIGRLTREDVDGNRSVRSTRLRPYRLPVRRLRELLDAYHSGDSSYVVYSRDLGWDVRPDDGPSGGAAGTPLGATATSPPAAGRADSAGVTLRIALFGDSFTAGSGPGEGSWGSLLESSLRAHGVPAQVLNFGVGGYGLDQAYLRWRKLGRAAAPQIVILGFQPENVKRDLNLIRLLYVPDSGLPFSKPRFLLEGGGLKLINVPAAPPESLPAILARLGAWPLARHERFHEPGDSGDGFWLRSRALAFAAAVIERGGWWSEAKERGYYRPGSEGGALALEIIRRFGAEAESAGARFMIVHLPRKENLRRLNSRRGRLVYSELLAELERRHPVIETSEALGRAARERGYRTLFGGGSHYVAAGNRVVVDAVAAAVLARRDRGPGVDSSAQAARRR